MLWMEWHRRTVSGVLSFCFLIREINPRDTLEDLEDFFLPYWAPKTSLSAQFCFVSLLSSSNFSTSPSFNDFFPQIEPKGLYRTGIAFYSACTVQPLYTFLH